MSTVPPLEEIGRRVREALRSHLGSAVDGLPGDAELAEALPDRYDSIGALTCITRIEEEFGIEADFVGHDVRHWFATTDRITRYVSDQLEDRAALGAVR